MILLIKWFNMFIEFIFFFIMIIFVIFIVLILYCLYVCIYVCIDRDLNVLYYFGIKEFRRKVIVFF